MGKILAAAALLIAQSQAQISPFVSKQEPIGLAFWNPGHPPYCSVIIGSDQTKAGVATLSVRRLDGADGFDILVPTHAPDGDGAVMGQLSLDSETALATMSASVNQGTFTLDWSSNEIGWINRLISTSSFTVSPPSEEGRDLIRKNRFF